MTDAERKHINNGIWLCDTCATLIDSDENTFTKALLHRWKDQHYEWVRANLPGMARLSEMDRGNLNSLASLGAVSVQTLESIVSPPTPLPRSETLFFTASGVYSSDKDSIFVVSELGNGGFAPITVRDVELVVVNHGRLFPVAVLDGTFIDGHIWKDRAPFLVQPGARVKVAWSFPGYSLSVGPLLDRRQPLAASLWLSLFPLRQLTQDFDIFSVRYLQERELEDALRTRLARNWRTNDKLMTAVDEQSEVPVRDVDVDVASAEFLVFERTSEPGEDYFHFEFECGWRGTLVADPDGDMGIDGRLTAAGMDYGGEVEFTAISVTTDLGHDDDEAG